MSMTLSQRFWAKVKKSSCCWEFTGARKESGHGVIALGGRGTGLKRATHVAWFLTFGEWPKSQLNHICNNAWCVNPVHVYEGTPKQNSKDMDIAGRRSKVRAKGEANGAAVLTQAQVDYIRSSPLGCHRLAKELGCGKSTILRVRRRETWA